MGLSHSAEFLPKIYDQKTERRDFLNKSSAAPPVNPQRLAQIKRMGRVEPRISWADLGRLGRTEDKEFALVTARENVSELY